MTTPEKLKLADDLEIALQNVSPLPIGVFGNLSQFIRTLRSNRTVVLEFREPMDSEPGKLLGWWKGNLWGELQDERYTGPGRQFKPDLVAPLPDLREIETEKGSGE